MVQADCHGYWSQGPRLSAEPASRRRDA